LRNETTAEVLNVIGRLPHHSFDLLFTPPLSLGDEASESSTTVIELTFNSFSSSIFIHSKLSLGCQEHILPRCLLPDTACAKPSPTRSTLRLLCSLATTTVTTASVRAVLLTVSAYPVNAVLLDKSCRITCGASAGQFDIRALRQSSQRSKLSTSTSC
jgi:hypothetical protein